MNVFMLRYDNDAPAPWLLEEESDMLADISSAVAEAVMQGEGTSVDISIEIVEMGAAEFRRHLDAVDGYSRAFEEMQRAGTVDE